MPGIDRHSRIVGWLKLALPLAALALLSTLFLVADRIDPEAAIPYAKVDVEDLARDPRMTAPAYAGTTSDGAALTLTAEAARPANGDRVAEADGISVKLTMPGGGSTDVTAATARLDTAAGQLALTGGVTISTSSGYRVTTEGLTAELDRSAMESGGPVTAEGPAGRIEAQSFALTQDGTAGSVASEGRKPYLLVFSGQVKLVYQPAPAGALPDDAPAETPAEPDNAPVDALP